MWIGAPSPLNWSLNRWSQKETIYPVYPELKWTERSGASDGYPTVRTWERPLWNNFLVQKFKYTNNKLLFHEVLETRSEEATSLAPVLGYRPAWTPRWPTASPPVLQNFQPVVWSQVAAWWVGGFAVIRQTARPMLADNVIFIRMAIYCARKCFWNI